MVPGVTRPSWRSTTRNRCSPMRAGNAPFFKENPGLRQTLAAWLPLDRTMRGEREDWERIKQERAEQKRLEQRRSRSQGISM